MECKIKNKSRCSCRHTNCSNWAVCCDCVANHKRKNELPACYFTPEAEKTDDRSIKHYIKLYNEGKV
jgi:hypothetical protein